MMFSSAKEFIFFSFFNNYVRSDIPVQAGKLGNATEDKSSRGAIVVSQCLSYHLFHSDENDRQRIRWT